MNMDDLPDELIPVALTQTHDNFTTLKLLRREINVIMKHGIQPEEAWYEDHSHHVYSYMEIGWTDIAQRFKQKDNTLYLSATNVSTLLSVLLEELSTSVRFTLVTYYKMIEEIHHIWLYYRDTYVGNETDENIVSMIESLTFMMK